MDYCGVKFTVVESSQGSWKWQLSIIDNDKVKTSGAAANRTAAIEEAHHTIGEGLRAKDVPDHEVPLPHLANAVFQILHGARSLPPAEAVEALCPFMNTMRDRAALTDRLANAAIVAISALVQRLETKGIAPDDLWEEAIESTLSFANETR